jgi:hypothetical protein
LKATTTPNLDCDHAIIVEMVPAAEDIELQKLECSGDDDCNNIYAEKKVVYVDKCRS